ncbi:MAG: site-specific integrase [Acidiferrobacter thiooxydans]
MACFQKRSGAWRAIVKRKNYPITTRTFDSKAQAEVWARGVEEEMDRGVFASRTEADNTTLAEALARYRKEVSSQKRGAVQEVSVITALTASALGRQTLGSLQGKALAQYRDALLSEGYSPITIKRRFAILSHLYKIAAQEWGMGELVNPVPRVSIPRIQNARDRRLVDDELPRLLVAATAYGGDIGPLTIWAIETAMRRGEIAAMRWEHLDRRARVLLLPETKNGTPRRVPLSTAALGVLDGLPRQLDGKVWGMRPDSISQAFERVCKAAGIEGLTFHDLRHEATSRLFEQGFNPMEVATITGHKTLQMLKRYTHLRAEDLAARMK